jgi:DNA invertase Pin-like site-specific DNA recombinase
MLDYTRAGDTVVVTAIDRLGRSVTEVTRTIADLGERRILLRSLREGIDTATPTGRALAAIMATLAELELELGRERRAASRQSRRARRCPQPSPTSSLLSDKSNFVGLPPQVSRFENSLLRSGWASHGLPLPQPGAAGTCLR